MKILVDADACPVKEIILQKANTHHTEVTMVCDVSHILSYDLPFVTVKTVDKGADSADLVLANLAQKEDICVTADYGLAALLLGKGAVVLHPNGFAYTQETIDRMLFERHLSKEMRRQKKRFSGHIKKRTAQQDEAFAALLENVLCQKKREAGL
ncbi:YaiI/YqxD family protein [Anaerotignum lactatifermentans]|uniref:UPF0178 protein H9X83_02265 n=1 Tax=Anaerotignum lactatifermentans TaxID=160404 RepID=A0ABS2G6C5_9FIRM|nr:YaiI/YqxD family protein [Anaerotignum lactatifermentans]MBM6828843.1 YaiI/YqxD family protein [Anaerotignum lactatifermentans]MBM6876984.1 YaiI/YqxD family protein [Anaerotignum lactatifermentans]MBM6950542.1 YaiI/YqxD family protein [Anaerotignum lactatifermentans]